MAEIDEKRPIESVKAALSMFEQKTDRQDCYPNSSGEKELDLLMKEFANCKLQLEIKESAYMQAAVKLDIYQRTLAKLSTQLKLSEADRDKYAEELKKSQAFVSVLESGFEVDKLKHMDEELLRLKAELTCTEESKAAALMKAELAERSVHLEKEKNKKLLVQVSELEEAVFSCSLAAVEAEKVKLAFFTAMEEELQAATEAVIWSHELQEHMESQLIVLKDLENELLERIFLTDYYRLELVQAKELIVTKTELLQTAISDERNFSASADEEAAVSPSRDKPQLLDSKNRLEVDVLKEELAVAKAEISDLKFTLEEATRRAEMAENAKSAVEAQLRKWREQQKQRRAASEAFQEQSGRRSPGRDKHRTASLQEGRVSNYVPLGKFLNMKF